ncbi:membrane protein insertase YidC [Pseudonocardia sp. RS11V-5]|uniref:membrane protein insertase YidC n=1 Tax=Pseudonocardia terrae TaxID=2905831 RepID=UPI001E422E95|nr:membrane protein insertase YidC [Pseudonocardia terrae]MCE3553557.1 membrane protein insertase YidC [Pseudonocardia terrae]
MLNFIYYPVSFIMWVWHQAFGFVFGANSGISWVLAVIFLVFTLRAILYKPFVGQVRSMRKMQEMAPEMQKLRKKYANDKQKLSQEMQKLQSENGANPLGGCLPVLVQVPVFIGLFHVLREFKPGQTENYFFGADEVRSFVDSDFFGAKLGASVVNTQYSTTSLADLGGNLTSQLIVMIPLMILAGIFTHITARHSVARQAANPATMANSQTAIMQKLMLYVFPIGVVVGGPFLPLAILFYWVSNNLWTLGQQYIVYKKIDAEEAEKKEQATAQRNSLAPKPGQKPQRDVRGSTNGLTDGTTNGSAPADEVDADSNGSVDGESPSAPAKKPGAKPVNKPKPGAKPVGGKPANRPAGQGGRPGGGGNRTQARKGKKRR